SIICFLCCCVLGNTINSNEQYISRHVGENVTLTCEYSTSSNGPYLFWYRQYPNQIEYLLYRGAKSYASMKHDGKYGKGKFDSITNDTSTELTIFSLTVEDSAVYLCALSDAAQWCLSITVQCKNLPLYIYYMPSRWHSPHTEAQEYSSH
uniref:Ig-like domain-containing protein n=1 Tax=Xenopus tropicalis TaxID=8364 RepID=A0A6I8QEW5_XENTR